MSISILQYKNALQTLNYIEAVKEDIAHTLLSKTKLLYSGIQVAQAEYSHAIDSINETIDLLFQHHRNEAGRVIERFEQQ